MKITLVGIGPDISTVRPHINPGLRRATFSVEIDEGLSDGVGSLDLSVIFQNGDNSSLQAAEEFARQAAARFLRGAAASLENE